VKVSIKVIFLTFSLQKTHNKQSLPLKLMMTFHLFCNSIAYISIMLNLIGFCCIFVLRGFSIDKNQFNFAQALNLFIGL